MSNVAGENEILGGAKIVSSSIARSTCMRSTMAGARFFAGVAATARRTLQHSVVGCGWGLAGLEWNGQTLWAVSGFAARFSAAIAQWLEIAIQEQIVIATIRQRAVAFTSVQSLSLRESSNVFFFADCCAARLGNFRIRRHWENVRRWRVFDGRFLLLNARRHQH